MVVLPLVVGITTLDASKNFKMKKKLFILTEQEFWKDYLFEGCDDVGYAICFDAVTLEAYIEIRPSLS